MSDAARRAAMKLSDAGLLGNSDPGRNVSENHQIRIEMQETAADIISAEYAREPARMQSREAIERAAAEAAHLAALVVYMSESTSLSDERTKKIAGEIKHAFSLEPCGHLATSLVDRDGKPVCLQCELEAEIVRMLRSLRSHSALVVKRDKEVGARDELAQMHTEELARLDALLAKLEGPTKDEAKR